MFNVANRTKETTTTTGNGTVTLAGAASGFQSFLTALGNAVVANVPYCIAGGTEWEVGHGTFNGPALTLARTTVESSSNAGNLVVFSAGSKDVFVTFTANDYKTGQDDRYGSSMFNFNPTAVSNALGGTLDVCKIDFKNPTITTGTPLNVAIAAALNLPAVPTTSSLGLTTAVAGRVVYGVAYNGGTPVACIANTSGGLVLDGTALVSPTTIGASSNSASTIYSASAVSANSPITPIGYADVTWTSGTGFTISNVQPFSASGIGASILVGLGYGQTWQNVSGSRALATTYYNTTGKPIFICPIVTDGAGALCTYTLTIDGAGRLQDTVTTTGYFLTMSSIIQPGSSYSVSGSGGTPQLSAWHELR